MQRETFQVEIVTPCFLGGARDQAEWRGASIRGQLRWWFRAVAGARFAGDLDQVRVAEEEIFGSTQRSSAVRISPSRGPEAEKGTGGEALLDDSVTAEELAERWGDSSRATVNRLRLQQSPRSNPLHYLAYGPVSRGRLERPLLPSHTLVSFTLQWMREPDSMEIFSLALHGWLCLGGIGARSRKGFGSLHLQGFDRKAFEDEVRKLLALGRGFPGEPEWTCFSEGSRVLIGEQGYDQAEEALSRLGGWLIAFRRRYGNATDGRTLGNQPVANRDYEWAAPRGAQPRQGIPDRIGFGLPLPFTRRVDGQFMGESVVWGPGEKDPRRASPLFLHVARFGKKYFPVLTYLPARFLPEGAKLGFKDHPFPPAGQVKPHRPGIVTHFLDDLAGKKLIKEIA
jgi:CRISPR-associated protein Cmr1